MNGSLVRYAGRVAGSTKTARVATLSNTQIEEGPDRTRRFSSTYRGFMDTLYSRKYHVDLKSEPRPYLIRWATLVTP